MEAVFLGIIAFSMLFIAIFALVRTIVFVILMLKLKNFLEEVRLDYYKNISPKIVDLLDSFKNLSILFKVFSFFRRKNEKK